MSQSVHGAGALVAQEAGRGAPGRSRSGGCGRTQAGRWVEAGPPEGARSSDRTPLAPAELGTGIHGRTFLTQMLNTHGTRWKDIEKPFSPAWLQFAAHTGGVGRLFSLCHVMDTPAPLRVATEEFPGTVFSGKGSRRRLHPGSPPSATGRGQFPSSAPGDRGRSSFFHSRRRPAPVPGGASARRAARPVPTFAPGRRVQIESPEWGRCACAPCAAAGPALAKRSAAPARPP